VKILSIAGKNLASLEDFEVALDRAPLSQAGLYVICGPTGAGKSTLLDAMCLALYAQTPRLKKDVEPLLRQSAVSAQAVVEFIGQDGERWRAEWKIRRAREKSTGDWQPPGVELIQVSSGQGVGSHKKTDTLRLIAEKVGLGFDEFCRAVLLAQGDFARFLKEKGTERARLLELVTGGELYSRLSIAAYRQNNLEQQKLLALQEGQKREAPLSEVERAQLDAKLLQVEAQVKRLADAQQAYDDLLSFHRAAQNHRERKQAAADELQSVQQQLADKKDLAQTLQQWAQALPLKPLLVEVERTSQEQKKKDGVAQSCKQQLAAVEQQHEAQAKLHQSTSERRQQLEQEQQHAEPLLNQLVQRSEEKQRLQKKHSEATAQLSQLQQQHRERAERIHAQREQQAQKQRERDQAQEFLDQHPALAWATDQQQSLRVHLEALLTQQQKQLDEEAQLAALLPKCEKAAQQLAQLVSQEVSLVSAHDEALQKQQLHKKQLEAHLEVQTELAARQEEQALAELGAGLKDYLRLLEQLQERLRHQQALVARLQHDAEQQKQAEAQLLLVQAEEKTQADLLQQLQHDLRIQEAAMELAARRPELLQAGEPCPLCGSKEHPHAEKEAPGRAALLFLQKKQKEAQAAVTGTNERAAQARLFVHELQTRCTERKKQAADGEAEQSRLQEELNLARVQLEQRPNTLALLFPEAVSSEEGLKLQKEKLQASLAQLKKRVEQLTNWQEQHRSLIAEQAGIHADVELRREQLDKLRQQLRDEKEKSQQQEQERIVLQTRHEVTLLGVKAQLTQLQVQLVQQGSWQELLAHNPKELLQVLAEGAAQWKMQLQRRDKAEEDRRKAEHEVQLLVQAQDQLAQQLAQQDDLQKQFAEELARLQQDEQQKWAELGQSVPQQSAQSQLAELPSKLAQAKEQEAQALQALHTVQQELAKCQEAHRGAEAQQVEVKQQLVEAQRLLSEGLQTAGFAELAQVQQLLAVTDAQRSEDKAKLDALRTGEALAQALLADRLGEQAAHQKQDLRPLLQQLQLEPEPACEPALLEIPTAAAAEAGKAKVAEQLQAQRNQSFLLRVQQEGDENKRSDLSKLAVELQNQTELCAKWAQLAGLIGKADGAKFRDFAQELTLEVLLLYANQHLAQLRPRYFLQQRSQSLDLQIVDRHMGEQVRDCSTLSGGESFLVSLALALSLSSLSARNVRVDSLFIDEGFGSLDRDTLDSVLASLEELQSRGQQIGIISHITELSERIAHRVLVLPERPGKSEVLVQVGGRLPGPPRRHAQPSPLRLTAKTG
jgi:exonuclease SbcC